MSELKDVLVEELLGMIEETFSKVSGHYLDRGTSLLETLTPLSAERVSRPHPVNGETVAAHVFHALFYLKVVDDYATGVNRARANWDESWVLKTVDETQWAALLEDLRKAEERLRATTQLDFSDPECFGGLLNMLVHTGFHLGALRQILDAT